ncbi:uncharacterized protein LOC130654018 isoform X1 [Hydractinia symbiolongicarpus]|uniref:uncharacterized protein LOC130654018 isoform X1 n=2 Tax=Hydractinia symbiolongicarpus TaxID=13093 RepID=UPI00254CC1D0|nr:uncharacterized protein LOC130654018 isoform X1 [Hydractinia symbiolongicarpus]
MENSKRKGSPTKAKRAKKIKKNDGIKKPTSAYIYFVSDYRMVLKKKGKDTSRVQDVAKLCGAAWKEMSDEEKAPYQQKYQTDRDRYLKEKEALDKKMGKDPNKPKRPQTAYFCFLAEFRKEIAGKTLKDGEKIPQLAGERWRDMKAENKKKYEEIVEKDKERYEKEMEEYRKNNPDQGKKPAPKKKVQEPVPESSDDDDDDSDDSEEEEDDSDDDSD